MFFARRLALLRLTALAALVVSAILTADAYHPERTFCPIAKACEVAKESALGMILGVPTSILGMAAFGGLFVMTLLPVERGRRLLRPAGLVAMLAGLGFVAYQAFVIHTWCPLCLVADVAGFVAGVLTLTWPRVPIRLSGKPIRGEPIFWRLGWTTAVVIAATLPFVWPRPAPPAWVEHTTTAELDELLLEDDEPEVLAGETADPTMSAAPREPAGSRAPARVARSPRVSKMPDAVMSFPTSRWQGGRRTSSTHVDARDPKPSPRRPASPSDPVADAPSAVPIPTDVDAPSSTAMTEHEPPRHEVEPAAERPAPRERPVIVEYLNAYCKHCRATHQRLEKVLHGFDRPVSLRRVYTWAEEGYPFWARACVYAGTVGKEDALFRQLMRARSDQPHEVYRAAKRVGIDVYAMQRAMKDPKPPKRLVKDRKVQEAARLEVLPTLDIGSRRLMGEQAEEELREAIQVALRERASQHQHAERRAEERAAERAKEREGAEETGASPE